MFHVDLLTNAGQPRRYQNKFAFIVFRYYFSEPKNELRIQKLFGLIGDQTELCTHVARAQSQVICSTSNCAASLMLHRQMKSSLHPRRHLRRAPSCRFIRGPHRAFPSRRASSCISIQKGLVVHPEGPRRASRRASSCIQKGLIVQIHTEVRRASSCRFIQKGLIVHPKGLIVQVQCLSRTVVIRKRCLMIRNQINICPVFQ